MSLLPMDALWSLIRCPICRGALSPTSSGATCAGVGGGARHGFGRVGSHPVLVDFSESVLDAEDVARRGAASVVARARSTHPLLASIVGRLRNPTPGDNVSARTLKRLRQESPRPRVLVVGGGTAGPSVRELYDSADVETIGFDVYASPLTQFVGDAHSIPLADRSVDGVWIQAVLEHVVDPHGVVAELHRVLRPRGLVYSEMPFMQQVHEGAFDFVRLTERGQRWLFRHFEEVETGIVAGPGESLVWSVDHFVRGLTRSRLLGRMSAVALFGLVWMDRLQRRAEAYDAASAFYFVGARSETALHVKELVRGYRGAQSRAHGLPPDR